MVLAAGVSRRMGGANKLLCDLHGAPLIVRTVDHVLQSAARPVIVVTGHQADGVAAALAGRPVMLVFNPDYASGMASSLRAGLAALPTGAVGAVVCLGDMPEVTGADIDRLIAAFDPAAGRGVCAPVHGGRRGNPVLWGRGHFARLAESAGDSGGRRLLDHPDGGFFAVPMAGAGVLNDVDGPSELAELRNRLASLSK